MTSVSSPAVVEPIRRAFTPEKAKAWHSKLHPYYTKQPSNVVAEYIHHFCPPGGLVVDPFCGTGVTGVEALTTRCRTVLLDLDPLATFITRQTLLCPVDLGAFWEAFRRVEREMRPVVSFLEKATQKELDEYKLEAWYPRGVKLPSNADRGYVEDLFGKAQLIGLAHLRAAIMRVKEAQARELLLFAFSGILARASLTYSIDSKHAGGGDSGIFKVYRYWVPPKPDYRDVWALFATRARLVASAKTRGNALLGDYPVEGETFAVHTDSAENLLKYVKPNSVDYIYTDPPYGAHITYLDLSTMWHAWLGLDVTKEQRASEAIVGGEQQFDEKHYLDVLEKSFKAMFLSLKDDCWLSLVFHHKQTNLWYQIRDMLRYTGFTYVNTVAQPLAKQTFHKVKNPLRVLGESLIVNFQKSSTRRIQQPMSLPMANIIKNTAERAIAREGGATTEEIMREVVPELFEAELFIDAASKNMGDILAILESDFELGSDDLWHLRAGRKLGDFILSHDRVRYYVISCLRTARLATFDEIVTKVLPLLTNGHEPTNQDIASVLKEVAVSRDGIHWQLKDPSLLAIQERLPFDSSVQERAPVEIPEGTTHNQQIYRLAVLCLRAGFVPYVGKQERINSMFDRLDPLTSLDLRTDPTNQRRIEQIDLIWATKDARPVWAFEIEESTSILSAFERFIALLSAVPDIGRNRRLTIVAPKARRRKLNQELTTSSYIGNPQFLENKLTYLYCEDLEKAFPRLSAKATLQIEELSGICKLPPSPISRGALL